MQKYRDDRPDDRRQYRVIFGEADHRALTLLQSFRLSVARWGIEESPERVHVNRFIDGAWFDDPDELRVDQAIVHLSHLTGWVGNSGLDVDYRLDHADASDDIWAVITSKSVAAFEAERDGRIVRLAQALRPTGDGTHFLGVEETWAVVISRPESEPLEGFIEAISDFQDLVSVGVGQSAAISKVMLQHPALPMYSLAGVPFENSRESVQYHARWRPRPDDRRDPIKASAMYFTFDDLGGINGVQRWLDVAASYRTELARVMATRYSTDMYLEDRIMNVCAALDSFDRQRRNTGKWIEYVKRIEQCVSLAGQPFLSLIAAEDASHWAAEVVETRDDLAHHRDRFRRHGSVGEHLLAEQLFWLFALCMLRLARVPDAAIDSITSHRQIHWLAEQAQQSRDDAL